MTRVLRSSLAAAALLVVLAAPATAQSGQEVIHDYIVDIRILSDGHLKITETIDYDFGTTRHHGIFRTIPTRFPYDEVNDRTYPIDEVTAQSDAPDDVDVSEEGSFTKIQVGDPDVEISGRHTYTLTYRVEGALNAFPDHDELYWNAIGDEWQAPIERARVTVTTPASIQRVTCFQGYQGSTEPCSRATSDGSEASFRPGRELSPFEGLTVVVAIPKGAVPEPHPVLEERWDATRAFTVNPITVTAAMSIFALLSVAVVRQWWRTGRDRRFRGSAIDQVMGSDTGEEEPVPLGEGDVEAPVEFAPPEKLHPAHMGVLLDERARTLHVTATIVDLAVRGHLVIQEREEKGLFHKPDWVLRKQEKRDDSLPRYERLLLDGLFKGGDEVWVSVLRNTFATKLHEVKEALVKNSVAQRWFVESPDRARARWLGRGIGLFLAGIVLTVVLALWTHWAIGGLGVIAAGGLLMAMAGAMPARTAKGTALVRRIRGFRRVIATAETNMSRWAEEENVFTRYLPYAIVFGLTKKWAKAFEDMGLTPDTPSWYIGTHPFTAVGLADSVDGFALTAGGTLASTPASSGSSGFGGGGFSGGGGGGGGGGSW
jgi:uncharacterized membrane protein YgcG